LNLCGKILETQSAGLEPTAENQAAVAAAAGNLERVAERLDALDAEARRHYRQLAAGLGATHRAVREEGAASAARDARTHDELSEIKAQIAKTQELMEQVREIFPVEIGRDPSERRLTPEQEQKVREWEERGDREKQALAKIARKEHAEADRIIQELKLAPLAEFFRLLILDGTNRYDEGRFDEAIGPFEQALALRPDDPYARTWAAIAHSQARLGDIAAHRRRAIDLLAGNLALHPDHSPDWARTQNNLGIAWATLPTGDRGENLRKAIAAYTAALEVFTRAAHPADWAATQNNLGAAWADLPTGDRGENLGKAIAAYTAALEVRTRAAHPADWAMTQNNLGVAWADLPTGDRGENLRKAIAAYTAALEVYTRAAHPVEWATTQNNLGNAWLNLPTGDRGENLGKAIAAYTAALEVHTRAAHPLDWAETRFNLGLAHAGLAGAGGGCADWRQAIGQVKAAAGVLTEAAFPHHFRERIAPMLALLRTGWREAGCGSDAEFEAIPPAE
jgi:tetratricopeptide (TPR) repeat protein